MEISFCRIQFSYLGLYLAEGLCDISPHMKDILRGLRELKKSSTMVFDMLKVFSEGHESSAVSFLYLILFSFKKRNFLMSTFCFLSVAGPVESQRVSSRRLQCKWRGAVNSLLQRQDIFWPFRWNYKGKRARLLEVSWILLFI